MVSQGDENRLRLIRNARAFLIGSGEGRRTKVRLVKVTGRSRA